MVEIESSNKDNIDMANVILKLLYKIIYHYYLMLIEPSERKKLSEYISKKISVENFTTIKVIVKGSYGKVLLIEKKTIKKFTN